MWGIPDSLPWEHKWRELEKIFSTFGLLYSIYVPAGRSSYAIIKYYSHHAAMNAVRCTDKKVTIDHSLIKVCDKKLASLLYCIGFANR